LIAIHPEILKPDAISRILVKAYEPAFGIIGDPAKGDPHTRQSADHSMVYIVATMLRKAIEAQDTLPEYAATDTLWQMLMLSPYDYNRDAIFHPMTRALMAKIAFEHGGPEYDAKYPDGIPTSVVITTEDGRELDSGLVMYPAGHARNTTADLAAILRHKFTLLGALALPDGADVPRLVAHLNELESLSAEEVTELYSFEIAHREGYE
jgi:2-methylcitrate dehydratase